MMEHLIRLFILPGVVSYTSLAGSTSCPVIHPSAPAAHQPFHLGNKTCVVPLSSLKHKLSSKVMKFTRSQFFFLSLMFRLVHMFVMTKWSKQIIYDKICISVKIRNENKKILVQSKSRLGEMQPYKCQRGYFISQKKIKHTIIMYLSSVTVVVIDTNTKTEKRRASRLLHAKQEM